MNKCKVYITCVATFVITACGSSSRESLSMRMQPEQHDLEIREQGVGSIAIDRVPNSVMMAGTDSGFVSYRIRFTDSSLIADQSKNEELNKYYQYSMSRDWVMLSNGDSLRPVFYQPSVKRFTHVNEGIAVFEINPATSADTLLFLDTKGIWGTHQLSLTDH